MDQILWLPMVSLWVNRHRRQYGGDPELIPPYWFFYVKVFSFLPSGSLHVQKKNRLIWWRPQPTACSFFFQSILSCVLIQWNVLMYILGDPFVPMQPPFYQVGMGPTPLKPIHSQETMMERAQICRWKIYVLKYPFGLINPCFYQWEVGPSLFEIQWKGRTLCSRAWLFRWEIYVLADPFVLIQPTYDMTSEGWVLSPFRINTQGGTYNQELGVVRWRMIPRHFENVLKKV